MQLFDPMSGNMACTICGSEVEEAPVAVGADSVNVMAKFNELVKPFFDLIKEIDLLDLSPDDLRSDFSESAYSLARGGAQSSSQGNWSSDRSRGDYNYVPQAITINIGEKQEMKLIDSTFARCVLKRQNDLRCPVKSKLKINTLDFFLLPPWKISLFFYTNLT